MWEAYSSSSSALGSTDGRRDPIMHTPLFCVGDDPLLATATAAVASFSSFG